MKHVLALLFALGALIAIGCAAGDALSIPRVQDCRTADQCDDGYICVEFQCRLASTAIGPDSVSVEIIPPNGSPYTRLHQLDVSLDNAARTLMLRLPTPVPYKAVVLDADGNRIPADLTIFGSERIPGRELEHRAFIDTESPGGTTFPLIEGSYAARVRPSNPSWPGLDVDQFSVRSGAAVPKEFVLPVKYRRLFGLVVQAQASRITYEGAVVQAIGEKSLLASTTGISDADGNYEIQLPDTTDTVFRVTAVLPSTEQPAWGFRESIRVSTNGDRQLDINLERSNEDNRGTVALSVLGRRTGSGGEAVVNARVTVTASVTDRLTPPEYTIRGTTDTNGRVVVSFGGESIDTIPLLRARYIVDVLPPANSPFSGSRTVYDFRSAGTNFTLDRQIQLEERTRVSGAIDSNLGRPVEAFVEFEPLAENLRARDTATDADGRYNLTMDPGPYLMVVRPMRPTQTGELLPVGVQRVDIPAGADHVLPQFRLAAGSTVEGIVRGDLQSEPVGRADVQMFIREANQTVSLGQTVTNADGAFSIVLPIP